MHVQQFVMAYGVEQDRLRALLPEGLTSLRPVLRLNAEIRDGRSACLEFNTAVERQDFRGWRNIAHWEDVPFTAEGESVLFHPPFLRLRFTGVAIQGGCPAEQDNGGCLFPGGTPELRLPEPVTARKEFCDCTFAWDFGTPGTHGQSLGKTLPAIPTEPKIAYPRQPLTAENAASIPCDQVLGAYRVAFRR